MCLQNGVENERVALRLFANVYGAVVMVPTAHLEPGIVQAYGTTLTGVIDLGRYPRGADDVARQIVRALGRSRFESAVREDVMRFKHAKLVMNLGNAVGALCGSGSSSEELTALAREEGRAVLQRRRHRLRRERGRRRHRAMAALRRPGDRRPPAGGVLDAAEPRTSGGVGRERLPERRDRAAGAPARHSDTGQRAAPAFDRGRCSRARRARERLRRGAARGAAVGHTEGHEARVEDVIAQGAAEIAAHAERELEALVAVSSPSGDIAGAEEAIALCVALLPPRGGGRARAVLDPRQRPRPRRADRRARLATAAAARSHRHGHQPRTRTRRSGATATACTGPAPRT